LDDVVLESFELIKGEEMKYKAVENNLSIRNSKNAKIGLHDFIDYIGCDKTNNMSLVEIGSFVGDSTEIWVNNFKSVQSIDPYLNNYDDKDAASYTWNMDDIHKLFIKKMKQYNNFKLLRMLSSKAVKLYEDESLDIVYIDGLHSYKGCMDDIIAWLPKVRKGGYIAGHDYQGRFQGVIDAVNEKFGKPDQTFKDTSWIVKVKEKLK